MLKCTNWCARRMLPAFCTHGGSKNSQSQWTCVLPGHVSRRGNRLVALTQAVQDVVRTKADVAKAERIHEAANEQLASVLAEVEAYVHADGEMQAREERSRAAAQAQRLAKEAEADGGADGAKGTDENNGRTLVNGHAVDGKMISNSGLEDSAGPPGLHMKPFKFSLGADT
jgi:hypothetical protein